VNRRSIDSDKARVKFDAIPISHAGYEVAYCTAAPAFRAAQGRHRKLLWRRHHAQTQTSGEEGKKKMRQFGKVDIPQEAFIAALKVDS